MRKGDRGGEGGREERRKEGERKRRKKRGREGEGRTEDKKNKHLDREQYTPGTIMPVL